MAAELPPIDITHSPELSRVADEVRATRRPRVLTRGDEAIAVVRPVVPAVRRRARRQATPSSHPNAWLAGLIGIAASDGVADVSANIHAHIAEAAYSEGGEPNRR